MMFNACLKGFCYLSIEEFMHQFQYYILWLISENNIINNIH